MIKLVFSNYRYIILAGIIFVGLLFPLLIISEYIFLEPYLVSHLPSGTEFGFVLIVAVSALSGLVLAMNVYRIKRLRNVSKKKMSGGIFGSIIGAAAGACSCGPIGFAVISSDIYIWQCRGNCNFISNKLRNSITDCSHCNFGNYILHYHPSPLY